MTEFTSRNIVLAVTGSIAAYKACDVIRELCRRGHNVRVILSDSGAKFITPLTLKTLSENRVITDGFSEEAAIDHVALAPWADAFLIAPATANCMAKCAYGIADDIVSTTYLCMEEVPVIFAPAMNTRMWNHRRIVENRKILEDKDFFIEPVEKLLACGETGQGGLAEPIDIVTSTLEILNELAE